MTSLTQARSFKTILPTPRCWERWLITVSHLVLAFDELLMWLWGNNAFKHFVFRLHDCRVKFNDFTKNQLMHLSQVIYFRLPWRVISAMPERGASHSEGLWVKGPNTGAVTANETRANKWARKEEEVGVGGGGCWSWVKGGGGRGSCQVTQTPLGSLIKFSTFPHSH